MVTDYIRYFKLNEKSYLFHEKKFSTETKDCQIFKVIDILGNQIFGVFIKFKVKSFNFDNLYFYDRHTSNGYIKLNWKNNTIIIWI